MLLHDREYTTCKTTQRTGQYGCHNPALLSNFSDSNNRGLEPGSVRNCMRSESSTPRVWMMPSRYRWSQSLASRQSDSRYQLLKTIFNFYQNHADRDDTPWIVQLSTLACNGYAETSHESRGCRNRYDRKKHGIT